MSSYFKGIASMEALKAEYKRLAKIHHPDCGGDDATMAEINDEYDRAVKGIASNPNHEDSKMAAAEDVEMFRSIIMKLVELDGVQIEICGSWLWIHGDTFKHKEALKGIGCRWSGNKRSWYWHDEREYSKSRRRYSMDEIRLMHGSAMVDGSKVERRVCLMV